MSSIDPIGESIESILLLNNNEKRLVSKFGCQCPEVFVRSNMWRDYEDPGLYGVFMKGSQK